jgi:hypothetical protein
MHAIRKTGSILSLFLLLKTDFLLSQAIDPAQMPFGGIVSHYEIITAPETDVSQLTAPGPAQAWRFKEGLIITALDTVQVYSQSTGSAAPAFAVSSIYGMGRIFDHPWLLYYEITGSRLFLTGYGQTLQDTTGLIPGVVMELPLDVDVRWVGNSLTQWTVDPDSPFFPFQNQTDTVIADASGSLTLLNDSYYVIRLQIHSTVQQVTNDARIQFNRIGYRWISPYIGTVLEIWSHAGETDPHFWEAEIIYRLLSTNVQEFGCDPTCDPNYNVPPAFSLSQNYPNPFNQSTRIRIAVPYASELKFRIYNTLGAVVYSFNDNVLPGIHVLTWAGEVQNGFPAASGFYIYRLWLTPDSGSSSIYETKQMILLR